MFSESCGPLAPASGRPWSSTTCNASRTSSTAPGPQSCRCGACSGPTPRRSTSSCGEPARTVAAVEAVVEASRRRDLVRRRDGRTGGGRRRRRDRTAGAAATTTPSSNKSAVTRSSTYRPLRPPRTGRVHPPFSRPRNWPSPPTSASTTASRSRTAHSGPGWWRTRCRWPGRCGRSTSSALVDTSDPAAQGTEVIEADEAG